ncbi:hypothetical protein B0H11DRAFT_1921553 [Mycena galericulata]|nr:hypothetical protein B0H11DRAFT_1921553 [Mycena galericulata]
MAPVLLMRKPHEEEEEEEEEEEVVLPEWRGATFEFKAMLQSPGSSAYLHIIGDITSGAQSGFRIATGTRADIGGASAQFPSSSQRQPASSSYLIIPGVYIPDLTKNDFGWKEAVRQGVSQRTHSTPTDMLSPRNAYPFYF